MSFRVLWDGYDLDELYFLFSTSRRLRLPWWNNNIGGTNRKVVIRFEKFKNGKWKECEDPRVPAALTAI